MKEFIRIINGKEYEEILRNKSYRYIPKKILLKCQNHLRPRILSTYVSSIDEEILGYGLGVFLNEQGVSRETYKAKVIEAINNLKKQDAYRNIEMLIFDDFPLEFEDLREVEQNCGLRSVSGKTLFSQKTLGFLEEVCKLKGEELCQKEVFIISDDTKVTEDLVSKLAAYTKFIGIFSQDEKFSEKLALDVFNKYGLSLQINKELKKIYNNFDFIVNLNEEFTFDTNDIAKNKIILDLSDSKSLTSHIKSKLKKLILVEDLYFENQSDIYSENNKCHFDNVLSTSVSQLLNNKVEKIEKVQIYDELYSIKEGIEILNFKQTEESCFNKR